MDRQNPSRMLLTVNQVANGYIVSTMRGTTPEGDRIANNPVEVLEMVAAELYSPEPVSVQVTRNKKNKD